MSSWELCRCLWQYREFSQERNRGNGCKNTFHLISMEITSQSFCMCGSQCVWVYVFRVLIACDSVHKGVCAPAWDCVSPFPSAYVSISFFKPSQALWYPTPKFQTISQQNSRLPYWGLLGFHCHVKNVKSDFSMDIFHKTSSRYTSHFSNKSAISKCFWDMATCFAVCYMWFFKLI